MTYCKMLVILIVITGYVESKTCWSDTWINNSNPAANGSEHEIASKAELDTICPHGVADVMCADEKGEPFKDYIFYKNAFVATCSLENGLICSPWNRNYSCPDFMIRYGCTCVTTPQVITTTTTAIISTTPESTPTTPESTPTTPGSTPTIKWSASTTMGSILTTIIGTPLTNENTYIDPSIIPPAQPTAQTSPNSTDRMVQATDSATVVTGTRALSPTHASSGSNQTGKTWALCGNGSNKGHYHTYTIIMMIVGNALLYS